MAKTMMGTTNEQEAAVVLRTQMVAVLTGGSDRGAVRHAARGIVLLAHRAARQRRRLRASNRRIRRRQIGHLAYSRRTARGPEMPRWVCSLVPRLGWRIFIENLEICLV